MLIKQISVEETYKLRLEVLKTCEAYEHEYKGDLDKDTVHFGAFKKDKLIGIVSLMKTSNNSFKANQIQLRGMAVSIEYQSIGVGVKLIKACELFCNKQQIKLIWCNARELAINFYKKQGFEKIGNSFHIKNVGVHFKMVKELNR